MSKLLSWSALAAFALVVPGVVLAAGGPVVNALINNYSGVLPGYPGYGIAPGSIFVIYGTGMSDNVPLQLQSSVAPGLPTTLNHASISVTVNGKTVTPGIYYAIPTQVAAVLPSTTPVGSGTITLTYNGQASQPIPIQVTPSAFGLGTLNQAGTGGILATDYPNYNLITPTASAAPGQTIIMWGSGLGADTNNNDRTYPNQQDNLANATVYIGGIKANVGFAGRSAFPGVDQINVTIPTQIQAGCGISVAVVAGGRVSNFGTIPVNPGNGICQDSLYGVNGTELTQAGDESSVKSGSVGLLQGTQPALTPGVVKGTKGPRAQSFQTLYLASADFSSITGASYIGGASFLSLGSCLVTLGNSGGGSSGTIKGLDAGSITLAGGGLSTQLMSLPLSVGSYFDELSTPLMGGSAYTFTGLGGKDVGAFSATITFPNPLTWTNETSISTVVEANGQLVTWTGGATGTYVGIGGGSSSSDGSLSGAFFCLAPVGVGQFTIPSYVLQTLPPGDGSLALYNSSNPVPFTATGIDHGAASASVYSSENVIYQ